MFPIHATSGRLVGFGGRTLGDDKAKYVNTPETEQFHKGRLLYGFYQAKRALRDEGKALLVEGYFDVIGAAASGLPWAVAAMGTSLTADQARLLSRYVDEVIVAYDGDAAGEKAFRRALPILLAAGLGVRRARFPEGHDPDSLRLEEGPEAVLEAVADAEDGLTLEIDRLTPVGLRDPFEKSRAASTIAELLAPIRDAVVRESYGKIAAERLGIRPEVLRRRGRPGTHSPPPEATAQGFLQEPTKSGDVRTEEEKALVLLLRSDGPLPPMEQLPSEKVFFDPVCRNIYRCFCALLEGGSARPPTGKEVIERMSSESGDLDGSSEGSGIETTNGLIDRAARLLLEEPDSAEGDLQGTFDLLLHRWHKIRQSELKTEILRAERENDQPRLARLLEEKKLLSRSLHPHMTGRLW
jgi:DNA primase